MTFTYSLTAPYTNLTRVRFAIRDTVEAAAIFTDEEINFRLSEESTWQRAVISLLVAKIGELANSPDFQADKLSITQATQLNALKALLAEKRQEYGIAAVTATTAYGWRPDSNQTEAPTWDDEDEDDD